MARCCGSQGSCACRITGSQFVTVTGSGTSQDPFVVESDRSLNVVDSEQFDLILTGDGTLTSPWTLQVVYAATAGLENIPDVDAPAPTNGQVLAWDTASQKWKPTAPTSASPGGVSTGNSIEGDGSVGSPLDVTDDNAKYLTIRSTGLGLTDAAINRLVRPYANATERAADVDPAPVEGALSMLLNDPGRIDYFDGTQWQPITNGVRPQVQTGELLALSGSYVDGGTLHDYVGQRSEVTDTNGDFILLSPADLTGYAGVLHVDVQETGQVAWKGTVWADDVNGQIMCRAFRLDDGTPYSGFTLDSTVRALLY